jgi:hypothetical protein
MHRVTGTTLALYLLRRSLAVLDEAIDDVSLAALLADEEGLRTEADVLAQALEAVKAVVERRGLGGGGGDGLACRGGGPALWRTATPSPARVPRPSRARAARRSACATAATRARAASTPALAILMEGIPREQAVKCAPLGERSNPG